MTDQLCQEISRATTLSQALQVILDTTGNCQGVLRIDNMDLAGYVSVSNERQITEVQVSTTGETGPAALQKLLAVENGRLSFSPLAAVQAPSNNEALAIDIRQLLLQPGPTAGAGAVPPVAEIETPPESPSARLRESRWKVDAPVEPAAASPEAPTQRGRSLRTAQIEEQPRRSSVRSSLFIALYTVLLIAGAGTILVLCWRGHGGGTGSEDEAVISRLTSDSARDASHPAAKPAPRSATPYFPPPASRAAGPAAPQGGGSSTGTLNMRSHHARTPDEIARTLEARLLQNPESMVLRDEFIQLCIRKQDFVRARQVCSEGIATTHDQRYLDRLHALMQMIEAAASRLAPGSGQPRNPRQ